MEHEKMNQCSEIEHELNHKDVIKYDKCFIYIVRIWSAVDDRWGGLLSHMRKQDSRKQGSKAVSQILDDIRGQWLSSHFRIGQLTRGER